MKIKPKPGQYRALNSPKEKRITLIVDEMAKGIWGAPQSRKYQKLWNLSESGMSQMTAEASRTLRMLIARDPESIKNCISSAYQHVIREASKDRKWGVVTQTLQAQAMLWGLNPIDIQVTQSAESLSDDEIAAKLQKGLEDLKASRDARH